MSEIIRDIAALLSAPFAVLYIVTGLRVLRLKAQQDEWRRSNNHYRELSRSLDKQYREAAKMRDELSARHSKVLEMLNEGTGPTHE